MKALINMQKNQKALPRLNYTTNPVYLVWFWFLCVFSTWFLHWSFVLGLANAAESMPDDMPGRCLSSAVLVSSALDAPSLLWFSLRCSSLFPSWQFYFQLTTLILLAHHIKISVSPGNQQCPQLSDCTELPFVALSFFSWQFLFLLDIPANMPINYLVLPC